MNFKQRKKEKFQKVLSANAIRGVQGKGRDRETNHQNTG